MTNLLETYVLAGLELPNRMAMAPMTRTRADNDRLPTDLMVEYYRQRASAGLIITECTAVRADSAGIMRSPGIYDEAQILHWKRITDAVHQAGGRIYLQIWHGGRISHESLQPGGETPIAPSAIAATGQLFTPQGRAAFPIPRALGTDEIAPLVDAFGTATANARDAGFDGVELHGAFGYLPDQFLQDGTNRRTDRYGGSVENRSRFMLEVVEAMTGAWDRDRIGVKLSPSSRFYGQSDTDAATTFGHVARALGAMRVSYLHVMEPSQADLDTGSVQVKRPTELLRSMFSGCMITNGGYDRARGDAVLAEGIADLVSFGVPFIANPDLVRRFAEGEPLNDPDPSTFYGEGPHGYIDYPAFTDADGR